jgi:hypothetical protein
MESTEGDTEWQHIFNRHGALLAQLVVEAKFHSQEGTILMNLSCNYLTCNLAFKFSN